MIIKNAKITSTMLGYEGHGLPSSFLNLDYGDSGQGFGGYHLGGKGMHIWVQNILKIAEVEKWEDLKGKNIRVKFDSDTWNARITAIGHFLKDEWFNPKEEFEKEVK